MDNYDEKLNYSFEPADPAPAEPAQPLQQAKEEILRTMRRSRSGWRRSAAAAGIPASRSRPCSLSWRSSPQPADTR